MSADDRALRRFVVATFVDALGSGLWMPFALLFLVHGQHLSLVGAGAALSLGTLLGLGTGPFAGALMDRIGPVMTLVLSNLVRLVAFCLYPLVTTGWAVVVIAAVVATGDRLFWTANAPYVTALTAGRGPERVLGIQTIGRFAGAGLGAMATALLPTLTSAFAYHVLAYANAASFAVAILLIAGLRSPGHDPHRIREQGGWATVLRTRGYGALCLTHVIFTLASSSKYTILPILVRDVLNAPQRISGIAIALGTVTLVVIQQPVTRLMSRWSRGTGLIAAAWLFAAGFAALASVTFIPLNAATVVIMMSSPAFAVAEAIFAPLSTAAAAAAAPEAAQGRSSALFQLSWGVSQVLAPLLLTNLLSVGNPVLWLTLTAITALAVPAVRWLGHRLPAGVLSQPEPR